jgi:hypothetical protein
MDSQRAVKISLKGTVISRDEARPLMVTAGDTVIVQRGVLRSLIMRCPCGCGDDLVVNLDRRAGPAWKIYLRKEKLSLFPSYWRDSACESHFILWQNRLYWCGRYDDTEDNYRDPALEAEILTKVESVDFIYYDTMADEIDAIPWEVLWCCRGMVNRGILEEKHGKERGWFRTLSGRSEA